MTPPRDAGEIAREILIALSDKYGVYVDDLLDGKTKDTIIAAALVAYGEACAQEHLKYRCFCMAGGTHWSLRCDGCHGIVRTDRDPIGEADAEGYRRGIEDAAREQCKWCAHGKPLRGDWHMWDEKVDGLGGWAMCNALSIRNLSKEA